MTEPTTQTLGRYVIQAELPKKKRRKVANAAPVVPVFTRPPVLLAQLAPRLIVGPRS